MRRAPLLAALLALSGAAALAARRRGGRERVSLQFEDGSLLALQPGTPPADRVLAAARDALAGAR